MRAFLSHSSKDKAFVRRVADALGDLEYELDERTFEYRLNVQEIFKAIQRSDIMVYFLSRESCVSPFVAEEQRLALEARGGGSLKSILVFALDETSYRSLPEWLRSVNVAQKLASPQACARRIQAALIDCEAEKLAQSDLYLGREADEALLRRALAVSAEKVPVALHVAGHHGIGRRTFTKNTMHRLYPRYYEAFPEVKLGQYQGIDDLYRSIYALHVGSTLTQTISDFQDFGNLSLREQSGRVADMISEMSAQGELLIIVDDGAVLQESGQYQEYISDIIARLGHLKRPALAFVQSRMMPVAMRGRLRDHHQQIQQLSETSTLELLGLTLQQLEIEYTDAELGQVAELLDGHPFNVRFASEFILNYGIRSLLNDPSDLVEWKRRRGEDFLQRITFGDIESDILAILSEYRYLSAEIFADILGISPDSSAQALRRLQEYCCLELSNYYFSVPTALRDAVSRDKRFSRPTEWMQNIARIVCNLVKDYLGDDNAPLQLVEAATLAAARGQDAPAFLSQLILPSHLLFIAREHYDAARRSDCIAFCKRAYAARRRLPTDAQIESLRLWGLSAVRAGLKDEYFYVISELRNHHSTYALKTRLFVEGLYHRLGGRLDEAETRFVEAHRLSRKNLSTNRELADLYSKQGQFSDAEPYARAAYELAPTNPYIIDVLANVLIGKDGQGHRVSADEITNLLDALELYGNAPGISFFAIRQAQMRLQAGNMPGAMDYINRAIELKPDLATPYFMRIQVHLNSGDTFRARQDLATVKSLLERSGGLSEGDEARAKEAEINIHVEEGQLKDALKKLLQTRDLPRRMRTRIEQNLATAITYTGSRAPELLAWLAERHA